VLPEGEAQRAAPAMAAQREALVRERAVTMAAPARAARREGARVSRGRRASQQREVVAAASREKGDERGT
jgi:hypothetical protein